MQRPLHFFALFLLFFCGFGASAQWRPTGNLTIFSEDGLPFYLILNGERYNDVAQTNIRIEELPNPYYNCRIIFQDRAIPELSKSVLNIVDADNIMQDVTYRIKRDNKGRNVLRFYSFIPAQQNMVRPANCAVYRFGAPNVLIAGPGFVANTGRGGTNVNVNVGGTSISVNTPGGGRVSSNSSYTDSRDYSYQNDVRYNDDRGRYNDSRYNDSRYNDNRYNDNRFNDSRQSNNNGRGNCRMAMNAADFNEARNSVAASSFDDTRLSTAKQIISANCMSAAQITTMLSVFSFESSKLDFAKFAFPFCVDKNNYFKINNAFSFESSKTDLNNYVQSMR
jgi:hypothetical protein